MVKAIKKSYFFNIMVAVSCFISMSVTHPANPSTTTVSVIIPALVQISGLSDITLAPISFGSPVTGATTGCIYTNVINPLGSYYITATSTNASAGVFRVTNGAHFISYDAFWSPTSSSAQTIALTSGIKTTQQSGGSSVSLACGGTPNANFNISFTNVQVAGASAGTYTDTVTLVVSPS
jgi:hypothetical protein